METLNLNIHKTVVLTDTKYVDLATVNGKLVTQVFTKKEEPNLFELSEELEGDQLQKVEDDHIMG